MYTVSETKLNKKTLTFPIPNATAVFLKSAKVANDKANKFRLASKIDKTSQKSVTFNSTEDAFEYLEFKIQAVVMAFTAIEAFLNETIPDSYEQIGRAHV